jgi:hypothetical protein
MISRICEFEVTRRSDYTLVRGRCQITMVMPGRGPGTIRLFPPRPNHLPRNGVAGHSGAVEHRVAPRTRHRLQERPQILYDPKAHPLQRDEQSRARSLSDSCLTEQPPDHDCGHPIEVIICPAHSYCRPPRNPRLAAPVFPDREAGMASAAAGPPGWRWPPHPIHLCSPT